jgi:nitroreductase
MPQNSVEQLTPDELLTTTPSVRKRLDLSRPVPLELVKDCLRVALQAPTGSSRQHWHFMIISDADKRRAIGELYARAWRQRNASRTTNYAPEDIRAQRLTRLVDSAAYLADHMHEVPVLLLACIEGRLAADAHNAGTASLFASILPAVWSFMLAARARRLGTVLTTVHLDYERECAEILGIPYETVTQAALVPVAFYTGEGFRPSPRLPLESVLHMDTWGFSRS